MNATSNYAPNAIAIRDTLFGDLPLTYWAGIDADGMPWDLFKQAKHSLDMGDANAAVQALRAIVATRGLEARQYLQACHFLQQLGAELPKTVLVLGVVVEVSMEEGHDLLAVYTDHSARYYNYTGGGIVWEQEDAEIAAKIDTIIQQGREIITHIGPWQGPRPAAPGPGKARLNILTSHGLFFGEAPQMALFNDPLGGKIMYSMLNMMETLINKRQSL